MGEYTLEDRPPEISEADWAKWLKRHEGFGSAAMVPCPGPLREVFAVVPRTVRAGKAGPEFTFVKLTVGVIPLLQEIESPILEAAKAIGKLDPAASAEAKEKALAMVGVRAGESEGAAAARQFNETMELLFVFTRPLPEVRAALRKGRAAFTETALACIADRIPLGDAEALGELQRAAGEHFALHFATRVDYEADTPNGDGSFRSPPAPKMALVGGLDSILP